MLRSVTHADGSALFVNAPELLPGAKEKVSRQLFAAVVRIAVSAESDARVWEIATNVAGALGAYGSRSGNELVPLRNDEYPAEEHERDLIRRQTRRSGMLLNAKELTGFVHLPSGDVASPRLRQKSGKTKALPAELKRGRGIEIGMNHHHGVETPFVLTNEQRVRHVHVIGASGTGKSSLLFNMVRQDVESGAGLTLLDPHGDLIDRVLEIIPTERVGDVVLIDPSDEEFTVGFNILSAHSDWEKNLLASDLVSVFRRNSSAWGDQMNSVLQNAILAILESDRGGTLLDLRRFLLEPAFRNEFLKTIRDENIQYYWRHGFASLSGNKSVGSIVTRLDAFLSPKPLRYMVGQKANRLDFGDIMGAGKILLAKLSQGAIGRDNAHLLGSLLVAKIQSEAMSRQRESEASRRDHFLYIDEFHDFL
ncbi:MAG: type IV secretion system DNA-binding domain-containing protein, partial [Spirochaetaceae bacterium]|nr:type IV secretion system DNA-binding domain-containing protein [Spirochaetaceae bacterium]